MRSMLILLAGCLPLAVLTVRSFVELGSIDERLGSPNPTPNVEVDAGLPASLRAEAQREEPAADALAEADLLAGAALPGVEDVGDESVFRPLGDDWHAGQDGEGEHQRRRESASVHRSRSRPRRSTRPVRAPYWRRAASSSSTWPITFSLSG
jgi:hypothetical protein